MDLEMIYVSQKEKDKYNTVSLMISYHRNRLTDIADWWSGKLGLADVGYYIYIG